MKKPARLPRILLTNDDGFDAPGITALTEVARPFAEEIWIVAPEHDQSGMGQSMTLNVPLRCTQRGERQWAVAGTPADCVIMALAHLMQDNKPSLLLSGVNNGANIGDDINLSGTLGAAFTGLMLGVPSIGISLDAASRKRARWDTARAVLPRILTHFLAEGWREETCLSVNIPDLRAQDIKGFSWAQPAHKTITQFRIDKREDLREKDYFWLYPGDGSAAPGKHSDVAVLARGEIAVTALALHRGVNVDAPSVKFDEQ